jgi:hypothetical protein
MWRDRLLTAYVLLSRLYQKSMIPNCTLAGSTGINFITFTWLVRMTKDAVQGLEAIWFTSMWSIWKTRNARIFHHKDLGYLIDCRKCQAFIVELVEIKVIKVEV